MTALFKNRTIPIASWREKTPCFPYKWSFPYIVELATMIMSRAECWNEIRGNGGLLRNIYTCYLSDLLSFILPIVIPCYTCNHSIDKKLMHCFKEGPGVIWPTKEVTQSAILGLRSAGVLCSVVVREHRLIAPHRCWVCDADAAKCLC